MISFLIAEIAHIYQNNERSKLYENMAAELGKEGPVFLGEGETSQSLKVCSFLHLFCWSIAIGSCSGLEFSTVDGLLHDDEIQLLISRAKGGG